MKNFFFLILIISVSASCRTKQSERILNKDTATIVLKADTGNIKTDSHYFWNAELDQEQGLVLKRTESLNEDSLTAPIIIHRINELYPDIRLQFIKTSNDSIFIKISKSDYLTEQMGSSGADAYLAEVTYNLTEIKDINYVDIRFKEGDHASPGVYSRIDFVHGK